MYSHVENSRACCRDNPLHNTEHGRSYTPGSTDVVLTWTTEPKKAGGKLTMAGTVAFKNPWVSADNKVSVTIVPTAGGTVVPNIVTLAANGTWSLELPLANFPNPAQNYDITPSVQADTGLGTIAYPVAGARKTLSLP